MDPILRMIHMTKINPSGWIKIPKGSYQVVKEHERTTSTNYEILVQWDQIQLYDRMEHSAINIMAFDIEADSSHGDFPIGIKNYQKLAQELITLYNEHGITGKKTKIHPMFHKSAKMLSKPFFN